MALVESEAAFKHRCDELSSDGSLHVAMGREGILTLSGLAFSIGTPQTAPTETQFDTFANRLFPAGPTLGQSSMVRRLHFEATTLIVASLRNRSQVNLQIPMLW